VEVEQRNILRSVDFAVVAVLLAALGAGLAALLYITSCQASVETDPNTRRYLLRLAWLSLAMLLLTVLIFTWVVVRYAAYRFRRSKPRQPTPYVDAWALAGQRYRVDEHPEDVGDELDWGQDRPEGHEGEKS
jgi:hypothetical protein